MSLLVEYGLLLQKQKIFDIKPYEKELSSRKYLLRNYTKLHAVENCYENCYETYLLNVQYAHQCVLKLFNENSFVTYRIFSR